MWKADIIVKHISVSVHVHVQCITEHTCTCVYTCTCTCTCTAFILLYMNTSSSIHKLLSAIVSYDRIAGLVYELIDNI